MHDLGGVAATKVVDGKTVRGFKIFVGGGLGAVPHQAKLLEEFVPEEELLPLARAIGRVFARLGEKKNRNRARLKFLVQKLGIEEFRRLVQEERRTMPEDPAWREHFDRVPDTKKNRRGGGANSRQRTGRRDTTSGPQPISTSSARRDITWRRSLARWGT